MKPTARLLLVATALLCACALARAQDASARRMALLEDDVTVEALAAALEDGDVLVARTAARVLPSKGAAAVPALGAALRHDDMLVRRCAALWAATPWSWSIARSATTTSSSARARSSR